MANPLKKPEPSLYETDFHAWTQQQAERLRARAHNDIDWENAAEEIESLGRNQKHKVRSHLRVLLIHLLKWQFQAERRTPSWKATIREQRNQITEQTEDSPSLRSLPAEILDEVYRQAVSHAADETDLPRRTFPATCPYPLDHILDEEFLPGSTEDTRN